MLKGLILLVFLQLLGDCIAHIFALPIPGAVIGMVILLFYLMLKGGLDSDLQLTAQKLFPFLPLLLIPTSVGVIQYLDLLKEEWFAITSALVLSLITGMIATPFVFGFFIRRFSGKPSPTDLPH